RQELLGLQGAAREYIVSQILRGQPEDLHGIEPLLHKLQIDNVGFSAEHARLIDTFLATINQAALEGFIRGVSTSIPGLPKPDKKTEARKFLLRYFSEERVTDDFLTMFLE